MSHGQLITVIVPIYNAGQYLVYCLDSIVNQTYHNLEIILVNDGSTDDSEKICREYMSRDPRIQLFCQEHQGQSAARNAGLDRMSGEYLIFVDADDYIDLSCIEILLEKLQECRVPIAVCGFDELSEEMPAQITAYRYNVYPCRKVSRNQIYDSLRSWRASADFKIVVGALYKREIFRTLRFPVGRVCEDEFVFHHIYSQVEYACHVNVKLYHYVQTSNSTMRSEGVHRARKDGIDALFQRLEYFQAYGKERYIRTSAYNILFLYKKLGQQSDMDDQQLQESLKQAIDEIERISGRRFCPFRIRLYILSPRLYRLIQSAYRKIKRKQALC